MKNPDSPDSTKPPIDIEVINNYLVQFSIITTKFQDLVIKDKQVMKFIELCLQILLYFKTESRVKQLVIIH